MIGNHILQSDLIADMKAAGAITTLLASSGEVRELQYQGADFAYPALRVHIDNNKPILTREQCDHANLSFTVRTFVEGGSSRPASEIATEVNRRFHRRNFHGTGWYSWFRTSAFLGPRMVAENLWMVETVFSGVVYPTAEFVEVVA